MKVDRRHCPHCGCYLSLKTYKSHRRLYYDVHSDIWHKTDAYSGKPLSASKQLDFASNTEYFTDVDSDVGDSDSSSPPLSVEESDCEASQHTDMYTSAPGI